MRIGVVSGSRADYGLLRPTIAALHEDERFELVLLVTAMHLQAEHGSTIQEIEADGFPIARRVTAGAPVQGRGDFARNLGATTLAFTDALEACAVDFLLVLGDRFEVLAAALSATGLSIPIAHVHGGELSEGSLDDAMRHCITKLAHLHFVATRAYAERVCQLGEEPWRVHVVGAAAIESIQQLELLERSELAEVLGSGDLEPPLIALTFHPESLAPDGAAADARTITEAVDAVLGGRGTIVVTLPNDDPGNAAVRHELAAWAARTPLVRPFASLGHLPYLSLLSHADAVIGNSSSAVIEAPSFRVPVVNVGRRQHGRTMARNVLSVPASRDAVADALRRALDPGFRESLTDLENPYDRGPVSRRILDVLDCDGHGADLRTKHFFDLPEGNWRSQLQLGEG